MSKEETENKEGEQSELILMLIGLGGIIILGVSCIIPIPIIFSLTNFTCYCCSAFVCQFTCPVPHPARLDSNTL